MDRLTRQLQADLTRTVNAQPAILAHSIALLRVIEVIKGGKPG